MAYTEDIEKIFLQEIREKKKTGTGSFHKRGKGVKNGMKGALKTPYHYMKEKDRKNLSGKVDSFNMKEILTIDLFKQKDIETQKMLLTHWREEFPNDEIKKGMGLHNKAFYDLVAELKIPAKPRTGNPGPRKAKAKIVEEPLQLIELSPMAAEPKKFFSGLKLEYNGTYTAEELSTVFSKLQLITEGENSQYEVLISFQEKNKNH